MWLPVTFVLRCPMTQLPLTIYLMEYSHTFTYPNLYPPHQPHPPTTPPTHSPALPIHLKEPHVSTQRGHFRVATVEDQ